MTNHVSFERGHAGGNQVFSCKQFGDFFLDRWEMFVPLPSTKKPDNCQALLNFIEWWLVMFCLEEVMQVAARSSAVGNSVTFFSTDERCSFFIPPQKNPTAVKHFWIFWLMTSHVLLEWAFTFYDQVLSCKHFGDFFLDKWEVFVLYPLTKNPDSCQALLNFIEWWLMMSRSNEVIQVAARSLAASNSLTLTD